MPQYYLCAACQHRFLPEDAVDGFAHGFRSGFLCPHCKANLTEYGQSDDLLHLQYGVPYALVMVLIFGIANMELIELPFTDAAQTDAVLTGLLLAFIPTLVFLLVNHKTLTGTRTLYTRQVDNGE